MGEQRIQSVLGSYEPSKNPISLSETQESIIDCFSDFTWDYTGITDSHGDLHSFSANSGFVSMRIECDAINKLITEFSDSGINILEADHTRQYPDTTLIGPDIDVDKIALDIKTGRRNQAKPHKLENALTLGSYSGYFQNPTKDTQYTKFPYASYDQHWILAFLYSWNPDYDPQNGTHFVSDIDVILAPKWKLSSKSSGSGTTNHIGSVTSIPRLKSHDGAFKSEEEFIEYWRNYGSV